MRVAAFTKYDRLAASTRQRVLQYVPRLKAAGIHVHYHPLLDNSYVRGLESGGRYSKFSVIQAYLQRVKQLLDLAEYDVIWVYAELFPYLPAMFERLALRSGAPLVYDFDDAFFHQYDDNSRTWVRKTLGGKLEPLLRGAGACCCGNQYLQSYASRFCENSLLFPTVVDTALYTPTANAGRQGPVTIGWIGSPSTWTYMRPLLPVLKKLVSTEDALVKVVGAGASGAADRFDGMQLVDWSEDREVADVQSMNIGIMPLPDEKWARGKSGYKLIQYMACGLPVVASPVGVNVDLVRQGENGLLAETAEEWEIALTTLIRSSSTRSRMGLLGRQQVIEDYSLGTHAPRLIELFRSLASTTNRPS